MSRVISSTNTEAYGETIVEEVSFDLASLDYGTSSHQEDAFVCSIGECTIPPPPPPPPCSLSNNTISYLYIFEFAQRTNQ